MVNPDNPHSFERLAGTDSCSVCGKQAHEHPSEANANVVPQPPRWPPSLEDLIDRVALTQEAIQLDQVPLLERVKVLALLKQAQALERIARSTALLAACVEDLWDRDQWTLRRFSQFVCFPCCKGEHHHCDDSVDIDCECPICHSEPSRTEMHHRFEGMDDNHFCTKCGGGRLHPIHSI